jgi:hypothetical protein
VHASGDGRVEEDVDALCREDEGTIDAFEHMLAEGRGVGEIARDNFDRRRQVRVLGLAGHGADCGAAGEEGTESLP